MGEAFRGAVEADGCAETMGTTAGSGSLGVAIGNRRWAAVAEGAGGGCC